MAEEPDEGKQDIEDAEDDKTPVVDTGEGNAEITVPAVPEDGKPAVDTPEPDTSAAPEAAASGEDTPDTSATPEAAASGEDTPDPSPAPAAVPVQDIPENDNTVPELPAASPVPVTEPSKGGDE
ncbi:hypothetical protein D3C81_1705950 [compost metagenome]